MDDKTTLRNKAKVLRKSFDVKNRSMFAVSAIRELALYKGAKNVMLFYPLKFEIDLTELLKDDKNFYLPRVEGKFIEVCPYRIGDELKKSNYSVMEPMSEKIFPDILDLIIVPALMVDKCNYRLGYGGGYYDRFLSKYSSIKTVVPIFKELVVEKLPVDNFDIQIDCIIEC